MINEFTFIEILKTGGFSVFVLLCLSILSVKIIIQKFAEIKTYKKDLSLTFLSLKEKSENTNHILFVHDLDDRDTPLARILKEGVLKENEKDLLEIQGNVELTKLEKNLSTLGTIGSTSPFIGLFGTVIGIIKAFNDISLNTGVGAMHISSGIAEALIATAAGLFVAIPAVVFYNYFKRKITDISLETEKHVITLSSFFEAK